MAQITPEYRALNAQLHKQDRTWGIIPLVWISLIKEVAERIGARRILDYGCGKGFLAASLRGVVNYDPAVPEFSSEPESADLVVCTATLEHIEPECLDDVLNHIERLTRKAVFITVSTCKSRKVLADGSNPHRIVEPIDWWLPHLMKRWKFCQAIKISDQTFFFLGKKR